MIFVLGQSGGNMLSRPSKCQNVNVKKIVNSFLSERVIKYWNKLPKEVKYSNSVLDFKIKLESYKSQCTMNDTGNFWEISTELLGKIEGINYSYNKLKHVEYLKCNPDVAKRQGINLYTST